MPGCNLGYKKSTAASGALANHASVLLEDLSGRYAPTEWAQRAIGAFTRYRADRVVAETNFGGQMVEATLRAVDATVPFTAITASRGKVLRAEPISAFYEQTRVHHVGTFADLEDQMCGFASDFNRATAGYSPDRVDALCFALSELLGGECFAGWVEFYGQQARIAHGLKPPMALPPPPAKNLVLANMLETITMKAPTPWADYYVGIRRYTANNDGIIKDVDPNHVEAMRRHGCEIDSVFPPNF